VYNIRELDLHFWKAYFPRFEESEHFMPVDLVQNYLQYLLELFKIENVKNKIISTAYPSPLQAAIAFKVFVREDIWKARVPKCRTLAWQEMKT
jgi:hypothetical protein